MKDPGRKLRMYQGHCEVNFLNRNIFMGAALRIAAIFILVFAFPWIIGYSTSMDAALTRNNSFAEQTVEIIELKEVDYRTNIAAIKILQNETYGIITFDNIIGIYYKWIGSFSLEPQRTGAPFLRTWSKNLSYSGTLEYAFFLKVLDSDIKYIYAGSEDIADFYDEDEVRQITLEDVKNSGVTGIFEVKDDYVFLAGVAHEEDEDISCWDVQTWNILAFDRNGEPVAYQREGTYLAEYF